MTNFGSERDARRTLLAAIGVLAASAGAAAAARALTPTRFLSDARSGVSFDELVPEAIGEWQLDPRAKAHIIDPQSSVALEAVYSETINRAYVRLDQSRVMLSIAYGANQRRNSMLHLPEQCYAAQGFRVDRQGTDQIEIDGTMIAVTRLVATTLTRTEPITYWIVIGNDIVRRGLALRLAHIRYGLAGIVPDGTLVRVSSIGSRLASEFAMQDQFVGAMVAATAVSHRARLVGAPSNGV